jgi:hypothetical protein
MRACNPNSLSLWDTAFTVSASSLQQGWTLHCPFQVFQWALLSSIIVQTTGGTKIFRARQDGSSWEPSDATDSCRSLFRKLIILPIACQYILSLMLFIVDNQKDFLINPAPVPWGLCDPSPLWLTFLFILSRILTSPFTYFIVRSS